MNFRRLAVLASATTLGLAIGQSGLAQSKQMEILREFGKHVPDVVGRSIKLGHTNPNTRIHGSLGIALADPEGLQNFVNQVSDPNSRFYRNYLTPEQVGERFGQSLSAVQTIANYLSSKGLTVTSIAKNRMSILFTGTTAQAEAAFKTEIDDFAAGPGEAGNSRYFSYSSNPKLPQGISSLVFDVTGLESFTKPQPRILTPTQARVLYNLAPIYNAGTQGQGRTLAISNFDGYRLSNVPLYYSQYGLPTPSGGVGSNITVVTISGGAGSGTPQAEGDLDIQMVLGMAPLCNFRIYDGGNSDLIGTLTAETNDNLADAISESYGWNLDAATATSAHNQHLSMSAQGITYMAASGDSGTSLEPYSYPDYDPEVLMVGGTVAGTDGSGNRTSEVGWSSGGGGWSTNTASFNTLPSWQHGNGVPTNINQRLVPDVALNAGSSPGAYYFYLNGALTSGYVGTSFASPVFCGGLGVAEQQLIANGKLPPNGAGKQRMGRLQDLIYSQNGRSDVWYDVTSGNNGNLPNGSASNAGAGWDFVTGWGAINWNGFVASQGSGGGGNPPAAPTGLTATAGNAQVSLTWSASTGATSYNVKRSTTSGGPYTTVGTSTSTAFTNTGLTNGTTYYFVVTAVNSAGESGNSNQASATPSGGGNPQQLILNPGFESGSANWTATAGVIAQNGPYEPAHTGTWDGWLCGYGTTHTDSVRQTVTIPSTITTATLSFWLHIDTAETTTTVAYDTLKVQIRNSSGTVLATLATYSNLNHNSGYAQHSFNVAAYKGQTIQVYLVGSEDSSLQTSFVVDDFALNVQ